ncbi:hypothetical protein SCT_2051 [Sulfuricella sp. T08]|uniref:cytochrome b/b6 domain-containing protein n=1 Tax=Sulfuricella sp. T08 TaxID=1632857 RepID=UPI0006179F10|nr:cytochrome b/b6 domain-containing protein [Sulfuricella sp. T08]GAO36641.1 hypothetical protein SCT_2051 [Sulfuricella sp. T08]
MKYDRTTYWLHAGLAFGVSAQLMFSLMMDAPRLGVPTGGMGDVFFQIHRMGGLGVLALLIVHWLWQLSGRASNGMKVLYPWLFKRRLSPSPTHRSIRGRLQVSAGTLQGLGLLIASLMAMTGLILYFGVTGDGGMSTFVTAIREVHSATAISLWIYLGLHWAISLLRFI